ncbi:MAG: hypothetical protein WBM43_04540 [Flavobacteriaceae bacterium]
MKCIELCPKGNYEAWEPLRRKALDIGVFRDELGQKLLFVDGKIRLWLIQLAPKERLAFTNLINDFQVMSYMQGFAVSHRDSGEIVLIQYKKGDIFRYKLEEQGGQVWDLENIGADHLEFVVIEELYLEEQE